MWLAYVVSHICYNARACASTCVRAQVMFLKSGRLALRGSAHEKHRRPALGPAGGSFHILPCTASYVLQRQPPPLGGVVSGGVKYYKIIVIFQVLFLFSHYCSNFIVLKIGSL